LDNDNLNIRVATYRSFLVILLLVYSCHLLFAQKPEKVSPIDELPLLEKIENLAESLEEGEDYSEFIEDLLYFSEHPLCLNHATYEELSRLAFLSERQIHKLLAYRETYGYLVTIYELQSIEGYDHNTIQRILPFVTVTGKKEERPIKLKNVLNFGKHKIIGRYQKIMQPRKGYEADGAYGLSGNPNSVYLGSPEKLYFRYGFNFNNRIRLGFTAEKDPGETFLLKEINDSIMNLTKEKLSGGFDFYSFHLFLRKVGVFKSIAVGDYHIRFGQGLTLWSGLAFGKSSEAMDVKRYPVGLSPYTSADENRFFRGIALATKMKNFQTTFFYSKNRVDANLTPGDSLTNENAYATMIQTGYHRTINELLNKDEMYVRVIGGNMNYRFKRLTTGVTGYHTGLEFKMPQDPGLHKLFDFSGKENINAGVDYNWIRNKMNFFGELAVSKNGGFAQLHGVSARLHPRLDFSVLYRNYKRNYQNFYCNPVAESYNSNEEGLYTGIKIDLGKRWMLKAYFDSFKYAWLRYSANHPGKGNDCLIKFEYSVSETVRMNIRFRSKNKQSNKSGQEVYIKPVIFTSRSGLRYHIDYEVSPTFSLKNRVECNWVKIGSGYKGRGYLIYQDVKYTSLNSGLVVYFRYALFDSDSYEERIYAYENDVLYAFSVPAYYFKGSRGIVLIRLKATNRFTTWLRLSHTWYSNQTSIGSGLEKIDGNQKTELKLQLQLKL